MSPANAALTADDVGKAAALLESVVVRTPLLTSQALDTELGMRVLGKAESLQRTGAFKFRGAYHHIASLTTEERNRGVVGASSGNHAQALALAARMLGAQATVVVPADAPTVKIEAVRRYGGTVVTYKRHYDDREAIVAALARDQGLAVVPSANSLSVMAGAGTVAAEILQDAPDIDTLLVPVGGGGLAAGCATFVKAFRPTIRIVGVEPVSGNDTQLSLLAGHRIAVSPPTTIADGLGHTTPTPMPFEINQQFLDEVVTVEDSAIAEAMRLSFRHFKLVVEPSGATALAALVTGQARRGFGQTAVVLSGGNVNWSNFKHLVSDIDGGA